MTVQKKNPNIQRVTGPEQLAEFALNYFIEEAKKACQTSEMFTVAISGGHTPIRFYELLAERPEGDEIDWKKVQLFWVDERCVPPEAEASNYRLAADTFLAKVNIPSENVHRVTAEADNYSKAVREYEDHIRKIFGIVPGDVPKFDLMVLGMGSDGHIGSLFPNSYASFDTNDLVTAVYLMDGDYNRITLTRPVICNTNHLLVMVAGAEKAQIVYEVFNEEVDEVKYPVHTLWPILDKVTWLIDEGAAAKL